MNNEKVIQQLNRLVEINNDRIEGYTTASKETSQQDLKSLFSQFIITSKNCLTELKGEVTQLGGKPTEGTKNTGKFFRVWMDVKAALASNDRKVVLNSCEAGEDAALDTYKDVLNDNNVIFPSNLKSMVNAQMALIKADHDKIRKLRDIAREKAHH